MSTEYFTFYGYVRLNCSPRSSISLGGYTLFISDDNVLHVRKDRLSSAWTIDWYSPIKYDFKAANTGKSILKDDIKELMCLIKRDGYSDYCEDYFD